MTPLKTLTFTLGAIGTLSTFSACGVVHQLDKCLVDPASCPTVEPTALPVSNSGSLGTITATTASSTQIDVSWTGVTGTNAFLIIIEGNSTPTTCTDGVEITNSSPYSVTGLTPSTLYTFAICQGTTGSFTIQTPITTGTTTGHTPTITSQAATHTGSGSDTFGQAVAILGSRALVGDPLPDRSQSDVPGKVYAFSLSGETWSNTQTLTGSLANAGEPDGFGSAIAMYGNGAVIGAPTRQNSLGVLTPAGAALYFEYSGSTWTERAVMIAGTVNEYNNQDHLFGKSVAIADGVIAVGAPGRMITNGVGVATANRVGEAYIFEGSGTTWPQTKRITASDGADEDKFGSSIAVSASEVIVGSVGATLNNTDHGAAYIYQKSSNWGGEVKIGTGSDVNAGSFGSRMSLSGNKLAVSDPTYDSSKGRVYIFAKASGTWSLNQTISAPSSSQGKFGDSLALTGLKLVVGAPRETSESQVKAGAFYLFSSTGGNFSQVRRIRATTPLESEYYGSAIAMDGSTILVGSDMLPDYLGQDGTAYFVDQSHVSGLR